MKLLLSQLIILVITVPLYAQLQGKVVYEQYGFEFTIPDGWIGQEGEEGILLGSNTVPGFVMLTIQNFTKAQLIEEARKGVSEQDGTYLSLSGPIDDLDDYSIGGLFQGTLGYEQAKAYLIGIGTDNKQFGVMILSAANSSSFSEANKKVALDLYASFKFKQSTTTASDDLQEWIDWFKNVRLVYMSSYYSSDYTSGIGVGGSSEERIDLCEQGYFRFNSYNDVTVSGANVSGYDQGGDQGNGTWEVIPNGRGYTLQLKFNNGEVSNYDLEYTNQELYLNGYRYYRITEGEERPNCY